MNTTPKLALIAILLSALPSPASAQTGLGRIGPSNGEVVGAFAGVAAVTGVVLYLVLRKPSITGCVRSADGTNSLTNEKDKNSYTLVDAGSRLKPGERLTLQGRKKKDKSGKLTFQVKKIKHDYGVCQP